MSGIDWDMNPLFSDAQANMKPVTVPASAPTNVLTAYLLVYFCGGGEFADVVSLVFHLYPHTSVPAYTTFD
ncbi:hypothetical protein [Yersinia enterocolitica]|uniref:hypothetical protein n=1 Tax=Yersinia enterocolitica TaxID=630 RepID=UPI003F5281FD|nr:hypothetical protein [Yersinia enterocolitica]